jgi:hypothetical protein
MNDMKYNYMSSEFEDDDEPYFELSRDRAAGMHADICAHYHNNSNQEDVDDINADEGC